MLDLIFPRTCIYCESVCGDYGVCERCLSDIKFLKERSVCIKCGLPFGLHNQSFNWSDVHHCKKCIVGVYSFEKARSVAFYDGILRDILHKFKYKGKLSLGHLISEILIENCPFTGETIDIIIPVPLYIVKLRSREYNQSVIMGRKLSKRLKVQFNPFVLIKTRDTLPQFEFKKEADKRKNVKGAFSIDKVDKIKGKSVLIIDDVFTSGSTVNECSRLLLKNGASSVKALTLMRAVH